MMKQRNIYLNFKFALMFIAEKISARIQVKVFGIVMPDVIDWTVNILVNCELMNKFKTNTDTIILETWCKNNVVMADYSISGDGRSIFWFNFNDEADAIAFRLNWF